MKMEVLIKFKCGNVATVHFVALKNRKTEVAAADIFLRAGLTDDSFLVKNEPPIEHYELEEVSNLIRATYEGLANITLAELGNNVFQTGVRIPVKIK